VTGKSWKNHVKRWYDLLETSEIPAFAAVATLVWKDLVANFHTSEGQGERNQLDVSDYDISFKGLRGLLASTLRRMGGAVLFHPNEDTKDRLKTEFMRTTWPKGRCPEVNPNWCVIDCALFMHYFCVDPGSIPNHTLSNLYNALYVRCLCYNTFFVWPSNI
jgi:hypothetical protein